MNPNRVRSLISIFIIVLLISACSPSAADFPPNSELSPEEEFETEIVPMTLTSADLIWPELTAAESCSPGLPGPSIKLCIKNENKRSASPELAHISVPAALVPEAQAAVLGSLPGGEWLPPIPLALTGVPGFNENAAGIIIVNSNPAPDAAAEGIVIINTMPGDPEGSEGIIIVNSFPTSTSAEGIIVVDSKVGAYAMMGEITIEFDFIAMSQQGSGASFGFAEMAADITKDGKGISGLITEMTEFSFIKNFHQMPRGIIWGGLVAQATEEMINSSPVTDGIEFGSVPNENKPAIVWGGMPTDAAGIIIVNNMPSPGSEAEGIIIVNNKEISQVMGISMEDKPGDDAASKGIIIVNSIPAPQSSQGMSMQGIVWGGIVWGGSEATEGASQSIVLQNTPSGAIGSLFGLPDGFGMPENMWPMMGDGGFVSGPMAVGQLAFAGDSYTVPAQEEKCFEILLSSLVPYLPGAGGESFPVDSFFDVFTELTVELPGSGESSIIVSRIEPPAYPVCTPTPGSISTLIPEIEAPTATPRVIPPTPTVRTGLPTKTPQSSRLPTPTPGRGSN